MHRESHITRLKPVAFGSTSLASNGHWTPQQQRGSYVSVVSSSRQCSLVNPTVGAEQPLQLRAVREHLATIFKTLVANQLVLRSRSRVGQEVSDRQALQGNGRHDALAWALRHCLLAARAVPPIVQNQLAPRALGAVTRAREMALWAGEQDVAATVHELLYATHGRLSAPSA